MKIFIAGHKGLAGSAIARFIETKTDHQWFGKDRNQLDLLDKNQVEEFFSTNKFDALVLAAAKVGGIKANMDYPVEFLSENLTIELNVINAAHNAQIERLLFLGSSCIYPKHAKQPIREEELLTGSLEPTNEPYALAKIAGIKLVQAYRKQFNHAWISAMPTNLYGPNDNFDLNNSHVLPALIAKFHKAKIGNQPTVTLWGSGIPKREFLYVDDLAEACVFLLENYDDGTPINIGTGVDLEIKQLAELIRGIVGFSGDILWDTAMPDGTPRKLLDVSRITELGWNAKTDLKIGVQETYKWFLNNLT